jgi:hypothetical protein
VKGPAAQKSGSFGDRNEGSSSDLPRVIFVPGAGPVIRAGSSPRDRPLPRPGRRRRSPSVSAVARELRAERARIDPV